MHGTARQPGRPALGPRQLRRHSPIATSSPRRRRLSPARYPARAGRNRAWRGQSSMSHAGRRARAECGCGGNLPGRRRIGAAGVKPARENVGILERLAAPCPALGSIACAASPMSWMRPRPQLSVRGRVNRPHFEHSRHDIEQRLEPRLGIGKARAHFLDIAGHRPAFLDPFLGIFLGDDVHYLAAAKVIGEEVPAGSEPLDVARRLEYVGGQVAALQERAPHHLAGIGWDYRRHRARGAPPNGCRPLRSQARRHA